LNSLLILQVYLVYFLYQVRRIYLSGTEKLTATLHQETNYEKRTVM
jgi:hypothetical protein